MTIEDYKAKISSDPSPEDVKLHADGSKYIPISIIENKLDELYTIWSWNLDREFFGRRGITVKGTLSCKHPVTGEMIHRSGTAAIDRTAGIRMDYPRGETMCLLNAAKKIGRWFGRDLNRDKDDAPQQLVTTLPEDVDTEKEFNLEFDKLKKKLSGTKDHGKAMEILKSTSFHLHPELNKIVNDKKSTVNE
jgi:hypothetical protein